MNNSINGFGNTKVEEFETQFKELLEKHNLEYLIVIDFPMYKMLPDEVQLAMKVMEKAGAKLNLVYSEKKVEKHE